MKIGDEVLVKVKVVDTGCDRKGTVHECIVKFPTAAGTKLLIGAESIVNIPQPPELIVWRDGAVERWNPVCPRDVEEGFYRISKGVDDKDPRWSKDLQGWDWAGLLWLPASEFPMPKLLEQQITTCFMPGCDNIPWIRTRKLDEGWRSQVVCVCGYTSNNYKSKQAAVDAHEELCKKVNKK